MLLTVAHVALDVLGFGVAATSATLCNVCRRYDELRDLLNVLGGF